MEKWKVIFKNSNYSISNRGRVKNIKHDKILNGKDIKHSQGYVVHRLVIDGISKQYKAHRLVAQHFLSNPSNLPVVNHKNGKRNDNRASNLEWCSYEYNSYHAQKITKNRSFISRSNILKIYKENTNVSLDKFVGKLLIKCG